MLYKLAFPQIITGILVRGISSKLNFSLQVRVREFYIAMQRCPYIHEMKERLLGAPVDAENKEPPRAPQDRALEAHDNQVGTIVKVSSCPFSSSY